MMVLDEPLPTSTSSEPRSDQAPLLRRVLFVTRTFPSGFELSVNGVYQRMRLFLEAASAISLHLDILFFVEPSFMARLDPVRFAGELKAQWGIDAHVRFAARGSSQRSWFDANVRPLWDVRSNNEVFKTSGLSQAKAVTAALAADTDLVFAFQFESALAVFASDAAMPPVALDLNDIEHVKFPRMLARPPHSWKKRLQYGYWPALFAGERRAIRDSGTTFVCSSAARDYLQRVTRSSNVKVAPNAVRFPSMTKAVGREPRTGKRPVLLFVGIYAYPPNLEGAEFLAREIFPRVLAEVPDARLVFVGSYVDKIAHLDGLSPNIEMRGFVEDLGEVYREASIACCPILAGGGTRTKIIEAAAYRVPVVSTTLGAEGIEFDDGTEIVIRDDAKSFAAACVDLLRDDQRAARIADAAYARAGMYDRNTVIGQIAVDLRTTAEQRG